MELITHLKDYHFKGKVIRKNKQFRKQLNYNLSTIILGNIPYRNCNKFMFINLAINISIKLNNILLLIFLNIINNYK